MKRVLDIFLSLAGIIICLPLMLVTALAIKLDTPGPIFYSRLASGERLYRIGPGGRLIRYFKFRSMVHDSPGRPCDVTRIGDIIRRWHIDELPELFLVLIGRMSLVGPRPISCDEPRSRIYRAQEWTKIKAGITGPAQLRGKRLQEEIALSLNLAYCRERNCLKDLMIILQTMRVIYQARKNPHVF